MIILALSLVLAGELNVEDWDCPQGSACAFGKEAVRDHKKAEAELEKAQTDFLATIHDRRVEEALALDAETILAVEEVLKAWRPAMVAECSVFGALTGGASPWKSAWTVSCEAGAAHDRAVLLKSANSCLKKPWPAPWVGEFPPSCLYPLTPSIPAKVYKESR